MNFAPPFPSCVAIEETKCVTDPAQVIPFQLYDKFVDGVTCVENEIGQKRAEF